MDEMFLFLDTETTGLTEEDRLLQVAFSFLGEEVVHCHNFKPELPIKLEAMATHHITEKMVANEQPFKGSDAEKRLKQFIDKGVTVVAHNAKFDIGMLAKEGLYVEKFLCTKNIAEHLLDLPMYKMQYLRYYFGIEIGEDVMAHSADGDVKVLKEVFAHLVEVAKQSPQAQSTKYDNAYPLLVELSKEPLLRKFRFGKYAGKTFAEVARDDMGYLTWLYGAEMKKPKAERNTQILNTIAYHKNGCQNELPI